MTKFQPSVAYKSVAYKIKRVLNQKRVYCSVLLFEIQYLKNGMPYEDGHFDRIWTKILRKMEPNQSPSCLL